MTSIAMALAVASVASAGAYRDVLGLRPGMSDHAVHERLEKLGKRAGEGSEESEESGGRRERWTLRDRRYGSVALEFDPEFTLDWATAFVHAAGKGRRVRFTDIGPLSRANKKGNYIYTWLLPLERGSRQIGITARGRDSVYITSVSIHRVLRDSIEATPR